MYSCADAVTALNSEVALKWTVTCTLPLGEWQGDSLHFRPIANRENCEVVSPNSCPAAMITLFIITSAVSLPELATYARAPSRASVRAISSSPLRFAN